MFKAVPGTVTDFTNDGVRLFLVFDFDGVFNAMYRSGTFAKQYFNPTHKEFHPNPHYNKHNRKRYVNGRLSGEPKSYELAWSNELVQNVNELTARDDVQLLWLTTWRGHMDDVSERLGFAPKREAFYLPWGTSDTSTHHLDKVDAFVDFFENVDDSVGVVWADDYVLDPSTSWYLTYTEGIRDNANRLLLGPDENYGLSRDEWDSVKDFATRFTA